MIDVHPTDGWRATTPAPPHRRMMLGETLVSTAINALIPAAIIWALALKPPATLWGPDGQVVTLGRAALLATFLMSLVVTALVRARLAKGVVPPLQRMAGFSWVPRPLVLRALFWAVCALATVLPAGLAAAQVLKLAELDRTGFALFNLLFGTLLGVGLTPFVVWLALTDARGGRGGRP